MSDWNTTVPEDGSEPWKYAAAETTLLCREIQMMMQIFGMHMKKDCIRKEKSEAARAELLQ